MSTGGPLRGVRIVELGGAAGAAYCGKLFADLGAEVARVEPPGGDPMQRRREDPDEPATEGLLHAWLNGGKSPLAAAELDRRIADSDLLLMGEAPSGHAPAARPRAATVDISWFGRSGPYAGWAGADLIVQALSGMVHPVGPAEGPPQFPGDVQAAMVGGATGFVAGMAALISAEALGHRRFEVAILEAYMIMAELQVADAEFLGRPCPREAVNRFHPTCPVGIYECKQGWLGVTVITPRQWAAFCEMLDLADMAADPGLATIRLRADRVGEVEAAINDRLARKTASEWAALGREMKVPLVIVPDAAGIVDHPVFKERGSLKPIEAGARPVLAPRSPIRVLGPAPENGAVGIGAAPLSQAPLAGIRIADFSMGWAGPLATRLMADLGAEVIKIEAGRYPDWWRATDWSREAIERKQFEESRRFAALNRGKKSISLDLTNEDGLGLARRMVSVSDVVIENQAAGVMDRLGLGYDRLRREKADLVMVSMSAFGSGNAWSDTRAYGSTLEHGSGLPSFCGAPDGPPTMAHIAYGDPVGGLYGGASILAALYHRQRTGAGQWVNLSQIECVLAFAAPGLLAHGATGRATGRVRRRRNRHVAMAPHGIFPAAGADRWLAIAVDSDDAWAALARAMGRDDWLADELGDVSARRAREAEIEAAIAGWTGSRDAAATAAMLQAAGVPAAPVLDPQAAFLDQQMVARGFFHDTDRPHVGPQRQAGIAVIEDGQRYPLRGNAPHLGGDSRDVLVDLLGVDPERYKALRDQGVISLKPTTLRG